jgi:hypothetical protein
MASTKKKPTAKKVDRPRWSFSAIRRALKPLVYLIGVAGLVVGISTARQSLRAHVDSQRPIALETTPLPDWIADDGSPAKRISSTDLSTTSAQKLTEQIASSPWVREVKVRRSKRGYFAEIDYRAPMLAVAWGDGRYCFADRDAMALDVETLTARGGIACLVVKGAQAIGFPSAGQPLSDRRLADVGHLAEKLLRVREPLNLETIHLTSDPKARFVRLEILTRSEGRILWGDLGKNDDKKLAMLVERTRLGANLGRGEIWDLEKLSTPNEATPRSASPVVSSTSP